jgi:hypothetical protein
VFVLHWPHVLEFQPWIGKEGAGANGVEKNQNKCKPEYAVSGPVRFNVIQTGGGRLGERHMYINENEKCGQCFH